MSKPVFKKMYLISAEKFDCMFSMINTKNEQMQNKSLQNHVEVNKISNHENINNKENGSNVADNLNLNANENIQLKEHENMKKNLKENMNDKSVQTECNDNQNKGTQTSPSINNHVKKHSREIITQANKTKSIYDCEMHSNKTPSKRKLQESDFLQNKHKWLKL